MHLKEQVEADLARRAGRLNGGRGKRWQDVADRLRADHPPAAALVAAYAEEMRRAREFVSTRGLGAIPDAPVATVPAPALLLPLIPVAAYDRPGPSSLAPAGALSVTPPGPR